MIYGGTESGPLESISRMTFGPVLGGLLTASTGRSGTMTIFTPISKAIINGFCCNTCYHRVLRKHIINRVISIILMLLSIILIGVLGRLCYKSLLSSEVGTCFFSLMSTILLIVGVLIFFNRSLKKFNLINVYEKSAYWKEKLSSISAQIDLSDLVFTWIKNNYKVNESYTKEENILLVKADNSDLANLTAIDTDGKRYWYNFFSKASDGNKFSALEGLTISGSFGKFSKFYPNVRLHDDFFYKTQKSYVFAEDRCLKSIITPE